MTSKSATETASFYPSTRQKWRAWLEKNHAKKDSVWLIIYKKNSGKPSITWSQAVDDALCYGWIDSKAQTIDEECYRQFYSKRKPKSAWSKINKEKVDQLIKEGLMRPAGMATIEIAKQNGSWNILDDVEELLIPKDLETAFRKYRGSKSFFLNLSKSVKKMMLHWIVQAKKPETRQNRIAEIAEMAGKKMKPKQF